MSWEAWLTLVVVGAVLFALVRNIAPPDALVLGGTIVVGLAGVISPAEALSGFSNAGMLTVGALFVVAAAMRETGALDALSRRIFGRARSERSALLRMSPAVVGMSAFFNNTPIVAMFIPAVIDWCRKHRVSPSRLLIPLSYLAIVGGTITLIGTSTNLVVNGMMGEAVKAHADRPEIVQALRPIRLFELAWVGLPLSLAGVLYLLTAGRRLLPNRKDLLEQLGDASREYMVDMRVDAGCRLIGQTVEEAGLRHLPGLFLVQIGREDQTISPVSPDTRLRAGDDLRFAGIVSTILDLERIPGLVPATVGGAAIPPAEQRSLRFSEAVISAQSPLIGKSIREADFRALYNAAVVAVHRGAARIEGKIGDIVLRAGDTLLLQAGPHFSRAHRNNPDFFLVSSVEDTRPVRHDRLGVSVLLMAGLVVLMATRVVPEVLAAFLIAGLMVATRCISASDARQSVDWQTLLTIAGAFGLGKALENSGAAHAFAELIVRAFGGEGAMPWAALAGVYLVTLIVTELITNNAAAVLMFPLSIAVSMELGVDARPFAMAVVFAASAGFATPIGYQTNMMVYGPGGYRFGDFARVGVPLDVLLGAIAVLIIPRVWGM